MGSRRALYLPDFQKHKATLRFQLNNVTNAYYDSSIEDGTTGNPAGSTGADTADLGAPQTFMASLELDYQRKGQLRGGAASGNSIARVGLPHFRKCHLRVGSFCRRSPHGKIDWSRRVPTDVASANADDANIRPFATHLEDA